MTTFSISVIKKLLRGENMGFKDTLHYLRMQQINKEIDLLRKIKDASGEALTMADDVRRGYLAQQSMDEERKKLAAELENYAAMLKEEYHVNRKPGDVRQVNK